MAEEYSSKLKENNLNFVDYNVRKQMCRVVSDFGFHLKPTFETNEEFQALPEECSEAAALELMKTKCTFLKLKKCELPQFRLFLLKKERKELDDLTALMTYFAEGQEYDCFKKAIGEIFTSAKSIEVLHFFSEGAEECFNKYLQFTVEPCVIVGLKKLDRLRELQIKVFSFDLKDVMALCLNNPNLEHINVNLKFDELPSEGDVIASLDNLVAFEFESSGDQDRKKWTELTVLCMNKLQNMQIVGETCSPFCKKYVVASGSIYADLRHLCLDNKGMKFTREFSKRFPLVSHLKIDFKGWKVPKYMERELLFTEIVSLSLQNITKKALLNFLDVYGLNLRELHALIDDNNNDTSMLLTFSSIIERCPNLEKIYVVSHCQILKREKTITSFARINELRIDLKDLIQSNIVEAPELKKLELQICEEFSGICLVYLRTLKADFIDRLVLQKLEHLTIDMCWLRAERVKKENFCKIAKLVKSAMVNLPKLTVVEFKLNYRCEYLTLVKALKQQNTTDEQIQALLCDGVSVESLNWIVDDKLISMLEDCYV